MTMDSLYVKSNAKRLTELGKHAPDTFKAFVAFDQLALAEGLIPKRTKELIAIAVAHVTGCPYCIEAHVTAAKKLEASKEEILEAVMVATALKAGSALAHGLNGLNAFDGTHDDELYKRSNMVRFKELGGANPDAFKAFNKFDMEAMKPGLISQKDKELMAIAVAHVTGCAYCIEAHTQKAKQLGISLEEITESIFVATALKAGSALAHSVNALNAYEG
ncbi:carboxymuconolactone decarboxylase family protein [Psychrobacillus sp. NEAU-3TGS]|uniref:carboxymuconolactone decarboxylase family protein n=1 Tax=Psychrobacillus sp. NEAU-3TGS TaxID=2995412 RepID=UPI002498C18D|nr:carboxymuconolactone decarboxylase family protein [Psychrobacillus sp. NEAU-3TGS]MDI2585875.1 carboxymuconolactone decarboxylase family protein [Psychrobacillus sp. NEAU-3TGS]